MINTYIVAINNDGYNGYDVIKTYSYVSKSGKHKSCYISSNYPSYSYALNNLGVIGTNTTIFTHSDRCFYYNPSYFKWRQIQIICIIVFWSYFIIFWYYGKY